MPPAGLNSSPSSTLPGGRCSSAPTSARSTTWRIA
jgi:hypothetical protein